ncbi:hypothetical protein CCMSSC00406_0008180 [Pleurotus cornucopiae]|uniref:Uncharacterized protein n=1 Tax=Pleurotus cornucopiae TaxID=5321 RepID=A0ACB7INM4_PLECO|nr:hypothetical protein CCMSSC00406_0008180 [Pleurotus cornucopiae]
MDSRSDLGDTLNDLTPDLFLTESVDNWRETYARLSSRLTENLRKVKEELTKGDLLSPQEFKKILTAQKAGKVGNEIYAQIKEIVTESQSALRKLSVEYESAPISDHPSYVTFSDGGIFLAASNGGLRCRGGPSRAQDLRQHPRGEFEKKDNSKAFFDVRTWYIRGVQGADDNLRRISRSTLYNDSCRRYVYAMTLEGKQLRMWYFCRSHIAIALPFNIHKVSHFRVLSAIIVDDIFKAQDDFILLLLFLVSATKEELGFDPTVVRVIRRTGTVFRYKVGDVYYETVSDPLNQDAAFRICSRSTRVWKVRKVVRDGARIGETRNYMS